MIDWHDEDQVFTLVLLFVVGDIFLATDKPVKKIPVLFCIFSACSGFDFFFWFSLNIYSCREEEGGREGGREGGLGEKGLFG